MILFCSDDRGTYMVDLSNPDGSGCRDYLACDNALTERSSPSVTIPTAHMTGLVNFFPVASKQCMQFKVLDGQIVKLDGTSCTDTNFVICEGLSCGQAHI